ncbi:uncharacterized protein [Littorina saxatilis]|uniref:uncharacterized protein n=1 Tax=Littorina saxatilis TaxID=31220 RepID=UPI0038B42525
MRRMDERSPIVLVRGQIWDKEGTQVTNRRDAYCKTPGNSYFSLKYISSEKADIRRIRTLLHQRSVKLMNESSALNSTRDFKSPSGHIVPQPNYKSFSCFGTWEMGFLLTVKQKMQRGCFFESTSRSCM